MKDTSTIILLSLMSGLTALSIDIFLPSLPDMALEFAVPLGEVSFTLSAFLMSFAVAQLFCGPLSDRFGRLPTLSVGLGLYVLATLLCTFAHSLNLLIAARFLQGLAACAGPVTAFAIVRDTYEKEKAARIYAYIAMATAIAPTIAPTLGSYLAAWRGWRVCFAALAALGVGLWVLVKLFLSETHRTPSSVDPRRVLRLYGTMLSHREFRLFTLASASAFAALMAFISTSSYLFITVLHFSMGAYAKVFAANALTLLVGSFVTGRVSGRVGIVGMIRLGAGFLLAGSSAMALGALLWPPSLVAILLPMMVCTFGISMVFPNGIAGALHPFKETAGSASALLGFVRFGAGAVMATFMSYLVGDTALSVGVAMFLCALVTRLCLVGL